MGNPANDLLAKLIAAGTPAELVAEVAQQIAVAEARLAVAQEAIEQRRSKDRERQTRKRSRDVTSCHVTERDIAENPPPFPPSPFFPPYPPTNPTHPYPPGIYSPCARVPAGGRLGTRTDRRRCVGCDGCDLARWRHRRGVGELSRLGKISSGQDGREERLAGNVAQLASSETRRKA